MSDIKQVLMMGLGAIGSIFAVKLKAYDPGCVRVLVDAPRMERYRANGIVLNGVRHDFAYVLPEPGQPPADLILIATKSDALPEAINAIEPFVHDQTLILALLNGITSEEQIAARYGWQKVLPAYFIGHGSMRDGNEIRHDGVGRIVFGDAAGNASERVKIVRRFFDQAGIPYEVPDDILFSMWCKFVVNVGINQASAILRASYGDFQRSEAVYNIALGLMQEAVAVAAQAGIPNVEAILPWCRQFIHSMTPGFKSSMLQDIEAGKPTEVDLFGVAVCALGSQYGIPTPQNAAFVTLIRALESLATTDRQAS
jgi:2-dehydropantoate 2-reductase